MRKALQLGLLLTVGAVGAGSCRDLGTGDGPARVAPDPAQKALAAVATGPAHIVIDPAGAEVTYHPGWSSRIRVSGPGGQREVYKQSRVYFGRYPREVVLGFRGAAVALFDPDHRVAQVSLETSDAQLWTFDENGERCPDNCPPGTDSLAVLSRAPVANRLAPALLALAPAERARASVETGPQHESLTQAGQSVTYLAAWTVSIEHVDVGGAVRAAYRSPGSAIQRPGEAALGFGDVSLAVFDPTLRIRSIRVRTLAGDEWRFQAAGSR